MIIQVTGKFSAVAVPERFARRGIGQALVKGAESLLLDIAKQQALNQQQSGETLSLEVAIEMGVINLRKDLFPWYEKQGYSVVEKIWPNDKEIEMIKLDHLDVHLVLMRKQLI